MRIDKRQQKEIALSVLSMIIPDYDKLSRDKQKELFNDMCRGVHKFILKEYHRHQSLENR
jgi:hypothetical protein